MLTRGSAVIKLNAIVKNIKEVGNYFVISNDSIKSSW